MNIVFITTRSITFNTFLKSQAESFVKNGYNVKIACSDSKNLNYKTQNYKIDFPTTYIQIFNIFRYVKVFFQIQKIIKFNKNSIFYLHTPVAAHLFRFFSFFQNLKIIYFVHGFRFTSQTNIVKSLIYKFIEKVLSLNTKVLITINNEDYNFAKNNLLIKVPTYKINGVGLDIKQKIKVKKIKSIKKIIVIAGYKSVKGYYNLLKAAEELKEKKIKIYCYGYGDYKKFEKIKFKRKLRNIYFNKFNVNLDKKIKKFDVLLHLSKREGLPVAVMECLREGVPVICKNIRGNCDLVIEGYNGFFVGTYRDVLVKISYLNLNPDLLNRLKVNASKSITKEYSKKSIN